MSQHTKVRRWPRFVAYLPVRCTPLGTGRSHPRPLAGKSECISPGGLALLLPETLSPGSPVLVQLCEEDPRRGYIVWIDRRMPTLLGTTVPHGVAFEQPVDPARVHQWVSQAERQSEPRVPVRFGVKFESTRARRAGDGTCLNLSREGMFIATQHPAKPGAEVLVHFTPPSMPHTLSVLARVAWKRGEKRGPSKISGMGVHFLGVNPLEAALIGMIVDRLSREAAPAPDCCGSVPPPG